MASSNFPYERTHDSPCPVMKEADVEYGFVRTLQKLKYTLRGGDLQLEAKYSAIGVEINGYEIKALSVIGRVGLKGSLGLSFPLIQGVPISNGVRTYADFNIYGNLAVRLGEVQAGKHKVLLGELG